MPLSFIVRLLYLVFSPLILTPLIFILGSQVQSYAQDGPIRIVVLPCYTSESANIDKRIAAHYRRTLSAINNQLVAHGFEVINPNAYTQLQEERNRLAERVRSDSVLAAGELCKRFQTDAAYLAWLDVRTSRLKDSSCRATITLEGVGYDAGGRDLGAGLVQSLHRNAPDCSAAILLAETAIGDLIGQALTGQGATVALSHSAAARPTAGKEQSPPHTLEVAAEQLVSRLALAYTEGDSFALTIQQSAPKGAGQPALRLGRTLDPLIAAAVETSPDLPRSLTPRLQYTLQPGYGMVGEDVQLTAQLIDDAGTVKATAVTRIARNLVKDDLLKPWVHEKKEVCTRYQPGGSDSPAASSAEARFLTARLGRSLGKIGLTTSECHEQDNGFRVISSVELYEEATGQGFTLVRAAVRVEIINPAGEVIDVFENEQTQPYGKRHRNKSIRQAIEKAMNSDLDRILATSLLAGRPEK